MIMVVLKSIFFLSVFLFFASVTWITIHEAIKSNFPVVGYIIIGSCLTMLWTVILAVVVGE
jgi:hypothetical protein